MLPKTVALELELLQPSVVVPQCQEVFGVG